MAVSCAVGPSSSTLRCFYLVGAVLAAWNHSESCADRVFARSGRLIASTPLLPNEPCGRRVAPEVAEEAGCSREVIAWLAHPLVHEIGFSPSPWLLLLAVPSLPFLHSPWKRRGGRRVKRKQEAAELDEGARFVMSNRGLIE